MRIIGLIKKFTENCLRKSGNVTDKTPFENLFGLPLLWNYLQDDTQERMVLAEETEPLNHIDVIKVCVDYVSDLTSSNYMDEAVKDKLLNMCMENVKNHTSIVQSLILAKNIFENILYQRRKKVLKKLDEDYKIITLIVDDFAMYLQHVQSTLSTNPIFISEGQIMNTIFAGHYAHSVNISTRLNTIYFFISTGQERMVIYETSHIDRLWDLLVLNSNTEEEKNLLFDFMREEYSCFFEYVFQNILNDSTKFDFSSITMAGYQLYERYFFAVNYNTRRLALDAKYYRVQSEDIIGINSLWKMLTEVTYEDVRYSICKLLSLLCTSLKQYTEEFSSKYWSNFFSKMYDNLYVSFEQRNEKGIKGIVNFINLLLRDFGNDGEIPSENDVNFSKEGKEYTFVYMLKDEKKTIRVAYNEYVFQVRWRVGYFFDIPINTLSFVSQRKVTDMSDDFKMFKDQFSSLYPIEVRSGKHPIFNLKNNPRNMLTEDSKLTKLLYDLLQNSSSCKLIYFNTNFF